MAYVMTGSSPVLVCSENTPYPHDVYKGEIRKKEKRLSPKSGPPAAVRMIILPTGNTVLTTEGYNDVASVRTRPTFIYLLA
jgi:hypothetical protein